MIKLLYSLGVSALVLAIVPCVLCGKQWRQDMARESDGLRSSVAGQVHAVERHGSNEDSETVSPVVAQATAFALYLNPPQPPPPPQTPPRVNPPQPVVRPVVVAPKFGLLSTSCHHSHPEKSLALISEPGRGERWVRKGDHLGHLVVESIKDGTLVYRDGDQLREVAVAARPTVELARPAPAAAVQIARPDVRLVNAAGMNEPDGRSPNDRPAEYERQ